MTDAATPLAPWRRRAIIAAATNPRAGQLRRRAALGNEAVYRVCHVGSQLVVVEVVRAPGLRAGQRFEFTRQAVAEMEVVSEAEI